VALIAFGTGEEYYERLFSELAAKYPDKVRVQIKYDNTIAHKIEAGSDIFLMPSKYEPSGLNQMYSLRYGTVPVVRSTGGLEDTIVELHGGQGNGFKFHGYNQWDFLDAIRRAVATFQNKEEWEEMMRRGMEQDFSWHRPAEEYAELYKRAVEARAWS